MMHCFKKTRKNTDPACNHHNAVLSKHPIRSTSFYF